jgi:hypothetical protein
MKFPATLKQGETIARNIRALAHAREWVRFFKTTKIPYGFASGGLALCAFDKLDNARLVIEMMKYLGRTPLGLLDVTQWARAEWALAELADIALRELIIEYDHRGEPKPPSLIAYNDEIVDPRRQFRRQSGTKLTDFHLRDILIAGGIADICWNFGLKPNRSQNLRPSDGRFRDDDILLRESGCSIMARALYLEGEAMGESAVVAIWRRHGKAVAYECPPKADFTL